MARTRSPKRTIRRNREGVALPLAAFLRADLPPATAGGDLAEAARLIPHGIAAPERGRNRRRLTELALWPHARRVGITFETRLAEAEAATEAALDRLLSGEPAEGEIARPARLVEAMRYAVLGGGKRLRPFLLIESARLFGAEGAAVVSAAASLECVHAYSLVHDDLPAMDDDDVRRGRPTVHKAFDEATAILAGDALLTLAFEVLGGIDASAETRTALIVALARASGVGGMAGGQMLDLDEGRRLGPGRPPRDATHEDRRAVRLCLGSRRDPRWRLR